MGKHYFRLAVSLVGGTTSLIIYVLVLIQTKPSGPGFDTLGSDGDEWGNAVPGMIFSFVVGYGIAVVALYARDWGLADAARARLTSASNSASKAVQERRAVGRAAEQNKPRSADDPNKGAASAPVVDDGPSHEKDQAGSLAPYTTSPSRPATTSRRPRSAASKHDVFLSYASADTGRAEAFAQQLTARTERTVWWDRQIPPGKNYEDVIEAAIDTAACIVVLWTEASIQSEWVRIEAGEGADRRSLIPVFLDDVRPPLRFRGLEGADLAENDDIEWEQLALAIAELMRAAPEEQ